MATDELDELSAFALGTQTREDRYGKHERNLSVYPGMADMRCNLTGLSQTENLYFVACGCDIHVYVPEPLTQSIPKEAAIVVPSTQSIPGKLGDLIPRLGHVINFLLVDFLGLEEVVAAVRDDGDVTIYLVRHIAQAIEIHTQQPHVTPEIKPIFHKNVGRSAWGLAIHTEARVIAVSANNHELWIFKLGLHHDDSTEDPSDQETEFTDRELDTIIRIQNGGANIPCVAFCNTGHDPKCRWLLTTDIRGMCRIIDLDNPNSQDSRAFAFNSIEQSIYRSHSMGWLIMFLDPRAFQPKKSLKSAMPVDGSKSVPLRSRGIEWLDVTKPNETADSDLIDGDEYNETLDCGFVEDFILSRMNNPTRNGDAIDPYNNEPKWPFLDNDRRDLCAGLPCPILHTTQNSSFLLQPSDGSQGFGAFAPPAVVRTHMLANWDQERRPWMGYYSRLNMQACIPSIGALILASQSGGVLLISLLKTPCTDARMSSMTKYVTRIDKILPHLDQEEEGDPDEEDNDEIQREKYSPLHGIAVSPMPGTAHLPDYRKRWRLILHYNDHSIFTYEIIRQQKTAPPSMMGPPNSINVPPIELVDLMI